MRLEKLSLFYVPQTRRFFSHKRTKKRARQFGLGGNESFLDQEYWIPQKLAIIGTLHKIQNIIKML